LHGALLDAELLADVYLAMSRGQNSLTMEIQVEEAAAAGEDQLADAPLPDVVVLHAVGDDLEAHMAVLAGLDKDSKGKTIWKALEQPPAA
jgi:DNA polymerase-3 subunit epsilon